MSAKKFRQLDEAQPAIERSDSGKHPSIEPLTSLGAKSKARSNISEYRSDLIHAT
jgi:hypothetical protein